MSRISLAPNLAAVMPLIATLLLAACVSPSGSPQAARAMASGCSLPAGAARVEQDLLAWINAERGARGLPAYRRSAALDRSAETHACDMASRGYFAHSRPGGPKLGARVKAAGYPMYKAGENLAYTRHLDAAAAAGIWRNSPGHWHTILDPDLREIGLSVAVSDGGRIYWVMDVAAPRWW